MGTYIGTNIGTKLIIKTPLRILKKKTQYNPISHKKERAVQTQNNCNTETKVLFIKNGIQNKIMRQIISHIKNQPSKNYSVVVPIGVLAEKINTSKESIRVSIKRLQKKNLLTRLYGERGRYGNTKINIPEKVVKKYFELFNDPPCSIHEHGNNLETKWEQNGNKYGNNCYSSSSIYKTTTTEEPKLESLLPHVSAGWENLDIEPLVSIGFTKDHLSQIINQNKLSSKIIQESIYAFAFDLQENNKAEKIKGDKISFFMGILCNGKPYLPSSNYESPQDKAVRLYAERMREIEGGRVAIEKEAMRLAFNAWFVELTGEQRKELLPVNMRNGARLENNKFLESSAWNKFKDEIWPTKKLEIIQQGNEPNEMQAK